MARLNWDAQGARYYETGIDRGVLYPISDIGVAWPGLIAVSESPSGGDPRPYYIDGIKYLNISAAEEFVASIEAFYAPAEFAECDGRTQIQNGLFATQQPRKTFGFSYRTLIGNDLDGSAHGYKIHLVYNALAAPAGRDYASNGDSVDPSIFSWDIETLPPSLNGYKPTAHMVVDSRTTDPAVLTQVEDLLYGTEANAPTLPTPNELVAIFTPTP